ncbi:MAG: hypothetical protein JXR37_19505 [Kiritimatiellae bacterium]|nr:hypothetical protein [Kiritimatiellia bacterium]
MSAKARWVVVIAVFVLVGIALIGGRLASRKPLPEGALRAAFDAEFLTRPDGYEGLTQHYGFRLAAEPVQMDPGLMYRAVADGAVDIIDGFATDGRIPAYDLLVLKDDKGFFPPYYAAPLIRAETLQQHPELEALLNGLSLRLPDEEMQKLNYEVDEKGRKAVEVARAFLISEKLIPLDAAPAAKTAGQVTIGSKHFTEQEILGELLALLIEGHTRIRVVRKLNLGGTMICFNALKAGDLDLYAEYTGTGLVNILKKPVIADPKKAYEAVKQAFRAQYGLVWLKPFGFNNTYTLTMRRAHAAELGIRTISDLAAQAKSGK